MRINKFKNFIGLCACEGCFKLMKAKAIVYAEKDGAIKTVTRFWVCHDCAWKICCPDLADKEAL